MSAPVCHVIKMSCQAYSVICKWRCVQFVATTATSDEATPDERAPFRVWSLLFLGCGKLVMAGLVRPADRSISMTASNNKTRRRAEAWPSTSLG